MAFTLFFQGTLIPVPPVEKGLAFLAEHDCEYGQGYYFARPLPLNEIQRFFDPNIAMLRQPRKRPGIQPGQT